MTRALLLLLLAPASSAAEPGSDEDFRGYVDQARFFLRKQWYDDALHQLELAVGTEDGRLDAEAWFLLAKVRYELGDLVGARFAADRALVHSRDDNQASQTHELLTFFEQKFGFVKVNGPYEGMTSQLTVTLESTLFDPDLKVWLNHVSEALTEPVVLPYELGLPAGRYTINGTAVDVTAGSHLSIAPNQLTGAPRALQVVEVELGFGATLTRTGGLGHRSAAPTTELSVGLPLGWLAIGAMAAWAPQPFTTSDGVSATSPWSWNAGLRAGIELPGTRPFVLRTSATWRIAELPGLEVPCANTDGDWICARDAEVRDLYVYTAAMGQLLGVELSGSYRDRSRGSGLGGGLKVSGDLLLGTLPSGGEAEGPSGPLQFEVAEPRGFTGGSWRILGFASYGF